MNEIINGMKVIKMYTWEKPFARLAHQARKEEIMVIRKTAFFRLVFSFWKSLEKQIFSRAANLTFSFTASRFILFSTFLVYSFTGEVR